MSDRETRVVLRSVRSNQSIDGTPADDLEVEFVVCSDDGNVLFTALNAKRQRGAWKVEMPQPYVSGNTITSTAWELANWMERMAEAIKNHTFDDFNLNNL